MLTRFNRFTGRPTSDSISDPDKYSRLTDAQNMIVSELAAICPHVLYPTTSGASIPTCTTADGGKTFTFGTDSNGYAIAPIGKVQIFTSLNNIPDAPWVEGADYVALGGTAIQIPNNGTYAGPLYWRGITDPPDISASSQPVLFPEASRILIAIRAAYEFGCEGNRNPAMATAMAQRYGAPIAGMAPAEFASWCATWKTQFRGGGALGTVTGLQVAVGSATNFGGA